MSSIYDWSTTPTTNATADTGINWAEGQPPSTVNNSARVMMARVAELLSDLGGVKVAAGSANAITLAAASAVTAYADGLRVTLRAVAPNTTTATLNLNNIGAKTIRKITASGETALTGGEIRATGIYEFVYSTILNGSAGGWLLLNPTPPVYVIPGIIDMYGGTSTPVGYLPCNGAAVSRTTFAALFAAIGTSWGNGDGTTTFNVPDLINEFIRGAGGGRAVGTKEAQSIQSHDHDVEDPGHSHNWGNTAKGQGLTPGNLGAFAQGGTPPGELNTASSFTGITVKATGGTETRPRNAAVLFIIKT